MEATCTAGAGRDAYDSIIGSNIDIHTTRSASRNVHDVGANATERRSTIRATNMVPQGMRPAAA